MRGQRIDLLVDLAVHAHGEPEAWEALVSFMERAAEMMAGDRGLRQMLMFAAYGHDRVSYARDRMRPAVGRLIERAQAQWPCVKLCREPAACRNCYVMGRDRFG